MTNLPVLRARGLTRRFGPRPALEGVDLELGPGDAVALLGGNGAGKTTLLRLAAGLLRASAGTIEVFGKNPRRVPPAERGSIGYLAHATLLYDDLTPLENLRLTASLYGLDDGEGRARAALAAMGLDGREDDPVRELSRGLQQRVAIARALVHRPSLLLLDEPTTGLDAEGARRLADAIRAAVAAGAAALVATHDAAFGSQAAPRSLRLERGRAVEGS